MKDSYHYGISGSSIAFLGDRVRKTARKGKENKLKSQYDNLKDLYRHIGENSVEVFNWQNNYYEMAFCPGVSFDVYCTMSTQQAAFYRMKEIIAILWENLYAKHTKRVNVHQYIDYLITRSRQYGELGPDVSELIQLLQRIQTRLKGSLLLEGAKGGLVHGDLTFENIMMTADSFVLLDSNPPPGGIGAMGMDIGKIRQSLFSYYELSKYSGPKARAGLKATYTYMADRFSFLFPFWNEALDIQARFYEASHYIRLLDYKHAVNPELSLYYHRKAVDTLQGIQDELAIKTGRIPS